MAAAAQEVYFRHFPHACLNAVIKADETEKLAMDGEGKIRIEGCLAALK